MRERDTIIRAFIITMLALALIPCFQVECFADTSDKTRLDSEAFSYYNFSIKIPKEGFCESQVIGQLGPIEEPVSALCALTTVLLGLFGLFRSKRTTMAFQFLYGLLASYGLFAAVYHVSLQNGFYRMMDASVSFVQSFIIIMLCHSLYLYRVKTKGRNKGNDGYRILASSVTGVFTVYPAAVHVYGESSPNPWVAWLVFDLLWFLIVILLFAIWRRRDTWPNTPAPENPKVFYLIWYAIGSCVVAYTGWSIDRFLCTGETPWLAYLHLHGVWHLFMGLCFYYLITLNRYFSAQEYGFEPALEFFPARGPIRLHFVEWKSRRP